MEQCKARKEQNGVVHGQNRRKGGSARLEKDKMGQCMARKGQNGAVQG